MASTAVLERATEMWAWYSLNFGELAVEIAGRSNQFKHRVILIVVDTTHCLSVYASDKRQWINTAFFLQEIVCEKNIRTIVPRYDITTWQNVRTGR